MKILVVNNNVLYEKESGLFVYKETGKFFVDLLQNGNTVTVFQFRMPFAGNALLADYNICNRNLEITAIKRRKNKVWAYIKAFFIGFYSVNKSDFVYLFYPGQICNILAIFCVILGKPFGFYVRGEKGITSNLSRFLYKKAKVIFTISPKFTERIKQAGTNVETVRPMMMFTEDDVLYNRKTKRKQFYNLLYVGRIERDKGVYEILEAIKNIIDNEIRNFKMHFVGEGFAANSLKKLTKDNELTNYIEFHGIVSKKDELSHIYKNADLLILPSYHEGFPRVLYEAMIFGVPIITTFVGSISYLMKDEYNCFRVEPKNVIELTTLIMNFLKDYEKLSFISENATQTFIDYLSDKKDKHAVRLINSIQGK